MYTINISLSLKHLTPLTHSKPLVTKPQTLPTHVGVNTTVEQVVILAKP